MWYRPVKSLFLYISDGLKSTGKIAGFDMDWTLTRTSRGAWPKDPSDIVLLPRRLETLNKLRNDGYTIVIFTNQKSTTESKTEFNFARVNNFINMVGPVILLMSTGDDEYRKPKIGMWEVLNQVVSNITEAFYSGDAAV